MDRVQEMIRFVRDFFEAHGANVAVDAKGCLTAELPRQLAGELGTAQRLRLTFSPANSHPEGDGEPAEFITYGHPLLDRMLALARSRGYAASLLVQGGLDPGLLESLCRYNPPLSMMNARARTLERRVVYHAQVMFVFKVSLVSDEKRERIVALWIDPVTEEIVRAVALNRALDFRLEQGETGQQSYPLERLYKRACAHLERRLQRSMRAFQRQVDERLAADLRRIEEYYGGLMQEQLEPLRKLFRRMAVAKVRADLARTWDTESRYREELSALKEELAQLEAGYEKELMALQREKEQRMREVREKYRTRVDVMLTHAAVVRTPRIQWRMRLAGQDVRRDVDLVFDVLRRRLIGWECEHCEGSLGASTYLCSCSSVVCDGCHRRCPGCGSSCCRSCAPGECHVCGGPVCPRCDGTCPLTAPQFDLRSEWSVCMDCREHWCAQCRLLVEGPPPLEPRPARSGRPDSP